MKKQPPATKPVKTKKTFKKPKLTVKPMAAMVEEVYAGWTPCSGDYHSTAFHGT